MRLTDRIYLAASGGLGMALTDHYDCNVYLLDAGESAVLIDTGAGIAPERLAAELQRDGFGLRDISHVILTHAHADHAGGTAELVRLTQAAVVCSPATAAILQLADEQAIALPAARAAGMYPPDYRFQACKPDLEVHHGDKLHIGQLTVEIAGTPGHSADSISCYVPAWKALFCGDVLFDGGSIAMLPTPDFSMFQLAQSVARLAAYEVEGLFPGHRNPRLSRGGEVVRQVNETFRALQVPPNLV